MRYRTRMSSLSNLAVVITILTVSAVSHARDSTWLLCKGTADYGAKPPLSRQYFVANLLEHRNATSTGREVLATLIFGDHVSRGTMNEDDKATALVLHSVAGKQPVTVSGTGQLAQDFKTFTLKGKFDPDFGDVANPTMVPFVAKLACVELSNEAKEAPVTATKDAKAPPTKDKAPPAPVADPAGLNYGQAFSLALAIQELHLPGNPPGQIPERGKFVVSATSIHCDHTDMRLSPGTSCEVSQRNVTRRLGQLASMAVERLLADAGIEPDVGAGNTRMRTGAVKCTLDWDGDHGSCTINR